MPIPIYTKNIFDPADETAEFIFLYNDFFNPSTPDYLKDIKLSKGIFDESVAYVRATPYKDWFPGLEVYVGLNVKSEEGTAGKNYVYKITALDEGIAKVPISGATAPTHSENSQELDGITYQYLYDILDFNKTTSQLNLINSKEAKIGSITVGSGEITIAPAAGYNFSGYTATDEIIIAGLKYDSNYSVYNGTYEIDSISSGNIILITDETETGSSYVYTDAVLGKKSYIDLAWIQDSTAYRALFNNDGTVSEPGLDAGTFDSSSNAVILLKSSLIDGITNYQQAAIFESTQFTDPKYFYDYLIEPGMLYSYMLQTATIDTTTNKILRRGSYTPISQRVNIIPDFTGSYLYGSDGIQINFTYNGKIDTFKEVKKDVIIETIGSKYPFVVRNSDIGYKQFSFSAMVVAISDPMRQLGGLTYSELMSGQDTVNINSFYEKFINEGPQQVLGDPTQINYIGNNPITGKPYITNKQYLNRNENFLTEREYRKKLFEWLYDGNPKIFKSDTEGLLIVKLTDINFQPIESLGRLLYSFSCTATEIAPFNYNSLVEYGFRKSSYSSNDLFSYSQLGSKILNWESNTFYPEGVYIYFNKNYYKVIFSGTSNGIPPTETEVGVPIVGLGNYVLEYVGNYVPGYFD
jgi:hypothetical protein